MTIIKFEDIGETRRTPIGDAEILDYNFVQHASGKYYTQYLYKDLMELLIADMRRNVQRDYDNVILITGGEGSGKSGCMYELLHRYKKDWDDSVDIEQSYTYNMDFMRDRFARSDFGNGIFWMDETTQIANNRDWQSQDNKDIVSILETFRSKKFLFGGCAPKLERVDVYIREFRMRYHIHVQPMAFKSTGYLPRGIFELEKRNPQSGKMEACGYGLYSDMPQSAKDIYLPLKDRCQEQLREKIATGGKGNRYKAMYEAESKKNKEIMLKLHTVQALPDEEIMELFGYDNRDSYNNMLTKTRKRLNGGKDEDP